MLCVRRSRPTAHISRPLSRFSSDDDPGRATAHSPAASGGSGGVTPTRPTDTDTGGAGARTGLPSAAVDSGADAGTSIPSGGQLVPAAMVGDWAFHYDFSCNGSVEGNATLRLNADGTFVSIESGRSYPGIWYVQDGSITVHFYYAGPGEGEPKGSAFTASVADFELKTLSGNFVSPLLSGSGCWTASR